MIAFSQVLFRMLCGPASTFRSRVPGFRRMIFTDINRFWLNVRYSGAMDWPQGPGTLPWEERMNKTFDLIFKALSEHKRVLLNDELFSGYLAWLPMILVWSLRHGFAAKFGPRSAPNPLQAQTWRKALACKRGLGARRLRASASRRVHACTPILELIL